MKQHKWIIIFSFRISFILKPLSTESGGRFNLLLPSHVCYLVAQIQVIFMQELSSCARNFCLWSAFSDGHSQSTYSTHMPVITRVCNCVLIYITYFVQTLYGAHPFCVIGIPAGHICLGGPALWQGLQEFSLWVITSSHWAYLSKMGHESKKVQALEQSPSASWFSPFINS